MKQFSGGESRGRLYIMRHAFLLRAHMRPAHSCAWPESARQPLKARVQFHGVCICQHSKNLLVCHLGLELHMKLYPPLILQCPMIESLVFEVQSR